MATAKIQTVKGLRVEIFSRTLRKNTTRPLTVWIVGTERERGLFWVERYAILIIDKLGFWRCVEMSFSDMVVGKNGLLVELRCHNSFNEKIYTDIIKYLSRHLSEWKSTGFIPVADAVSIFNLIDELSGGSQFWSEEMELRVEDAVLEIQELISSLEE